MIRAILIDDEENARIALQYLIQEHTPDIKIIGMFSSLKEAFEPINTLKPNVVFLDIQMPDETGLELWKYFPKPSFNVVFTTAYNQYAVQAIRLAAFDYLLKPIDIDELTQVSKRLQEQQYQSSLEQRLSALEANLKNSQGLSQLVIPTVDSLIVVRLDELVRAESESNYTNFHMVDGTRHLASKTIREFDGLLANKHFMRIHQSHIINLKYVAKIIKGKNSFAELKDGQKIPISRERRDDLIQAIGER